jgi:hypothetical protein
MYLEDATNEEVKAEALKRGYTFTDEDCQELRADSFEGETLNEALTDYLNAYER